VSEELTARAVAQRSPSRPGGRSRLPPPAPPRLPGPGGRRRPVMSEVGQELVHLVWGKKTGPRGLADTIFCRWAQGSCVRGVPCSPPPGPGPAGPPPASARPSASTCGAGRCRPLPLRASPRGCRGHCAPVEGRGAACGHLPALHGVGPSGK